MAITSQKTKLRHNTVQGACPILSSGSHASWRFIPLTRSQFAIVDADKYDWLMQWKWYAQWSKHTKSFYAVRGSKIKNGKQTTVSMAREILRLKKGDKCQADHINHNIFDNRRSNLRIVTNQQNQFNQKNPKGYCWYKRTGKYQAQIKLNGKLIHLGYFHTAKKAHNAYLKAKQQYHNIPK